MIVGLGVDLVDLNRMRRLLDDKGDRAWTRLFTEGEQQYARERPDPVLHLAARIAAKEAAFKALAGNELARGIGWRDMEVTNAGDGRPVLLLHRHAADRAREMEVSRSWLTLSHSATTAIAVVVMERD
jgi:holo-[acyl-carrier protein] synthase